MTASVSPLHAPSRHLRAVPDVAPLLRVVPEVLAPLSWRLHTHASAEGLDRAAWRVEQACADAWDQQAPAALAVAVMCPGADVDTVTWLVRQLLDASAEVARYELAGTFGRHWQHWVDVYGDTLHQLAQLVDGAKQ